MADSDDEYDRRRGRDKFRRERNDYQDNRNLNNRRDDWSDNWNSQSRNDRNPMRRDYRDNYNHNKSGNRMNYNRNDIYGSSTDRTGDMSPTNKRMRISGSGGGGSNRDWDERFSNYDLGGGGSGGSGGAGGGYHSSHGHGHLNFKDNWIHDRDRDDDLHQPPMMTLKQFVNEQDDNLDGELLITKYNEYKNEFKRLQIQEFFNRHKDEEWFRCKYYPDEMEKRKLKTKETIQKRLDVFMELYQSKYMDDVSLDVDKAEQIIKLFDAIVIKLEGGTDFDLLSLDSDLQEQKINDPIFAVESSTTTKASFSNNNNQNLNQNKLEKLSPRKEEGEEQEEEENGKIKSEIENENSGEINKNDGDNDGEKNEMELSFKEEEEEGDENEIKQKEEIKLEEEQEQHRGELMEEGEDKDSIKDSSSTNIDAMEDDNNVINKDNNDIVDKKPRALHKTCSIFFRNIAPSITRQEIEDECKKFPGFLRLALSEPQIDRRFNRRGWATYERTVNIREICWNLNNIKIRGTELSPIVNRDLTRRIRSVNGISSHKTVVRADIRHAAKLIMKLDEEKQLWIKDNNEKDSNTNDNNNETSGNDEKRNGSSSSTTTTSSALTTPSLNPLLKNITDYLIEEASAEEAELLGTSVDDVLISSNDALLDSSSSDLVQESNGQNTKEIGTDGGGTPLERDEDLIKVLDRLLFYLRIVHSIDYYNHCEYPNEDEMPNRIGLIHARGLISSARVSPIEIKEFIKEQENKIKPLLTQSSQTKLSMEEAKKLGLKDLDEAVDAFIKENTKDLGEGKWLCPLSNKKFMGAVFVQKHILNKHMERVEQVKTEAKYFNNYILDPKRPQLPEHPLNRPPQSQQSSSSQQQQNQHSLHHQFPHGIAGRMHGPIVDFNQRLNPMLGVYGLPATARYGGILPPPIMDPYNIRPNLKRRYRDLDAPIEE